MSNVSSINLWLLILGLCSCTGRYYSVDDFESVRKIDTHTHINTESNAFAVQAKQDNFQLLDVNVDVPGYAALENQNRFALAQVRQNPDRIKFLSAFSLQRWDSSDWTSLTIQKLKGAFDAGALGIKVWKNIGMTYKDAAGHFIMIDNPRFDSVINYVIHSDKTVMGHLGEPRNCWLPLEKMTVNSDREYFKAHPEYHMFLHPDYPSYEDQINARDRFIERHPDMRFVGAHLGSLEWDVDEIAKRLDKFPNMAVDMAARVCHLQVQTIQHREKVRNFFIKYQDRLIYATDSEVSTDDDAAAHARHLHDRWLADWKYFTTDQTLTAEEVNGSFTGLKLPREVIDKIYYSNAVRWFKF